MADCDGYIAKLCAIRRFTWLQTLLHAQGYHTVCANNGEHALACVANDPPDLILLDVMMPGVNSYQVAQTLKADPDTVSIPIILITALTNRNARIDGLQTGAEDFLTKPVDRDELWLRVRNLLSLKAFASLRNHARVLEEQIELRTSQLQTANKELQAFSYSVAHDLRTPLRAISGLADMLQKELGTSAATERSLHCITPIRAGTLQMNRLIDALLSLAQLSQMVINWETIDLSALAHTILEGYQEREPGRVVQLDIQPNLAAQGDPHLLRNVLENLFSNAWKYSSRKPQAASSDCVQSGKWPRWGVDVCRQRQRRRFWYGLLKQVVWDFSAVAHPGRI